MLRTWCFVGVVCVGSTLLVSCASGGANGGAVVGAPSEISFRGGNAFALPPGGEVTLTPLFDVGPLDGGAVVDPALAWRTDDADGDVLTIDGPRVTAVGPGTATVTAASVAFDDVERTATVTVTRELPRSSDLEFDANAMAVALLDETTVVVTPTSHDGGVDLAVGDLATSLRAFDTGGSVVSVLDGDPVLRMQAGGAVAVRGDGFVPGSLVGVFLGDGHVPLGAVVVGRDGRFRRSVQMPETFAVGDSVLFVSGTRTAGGLEAAADGTPDGTPAHDARATFAISVDVVGDADRIHAVDVTPDRVSMTPGGVAQLDAKVAATGVPDVVLDWSTGDETVATVDAHGVVTAVGEGEVRVTVASTSHPDVRDDAVVVVARAAVDATRTTVDVTPAALTADGRSTATIRVQLADAFGAAVDREAVLTVANVSNGRVGPFEAQGRGLYTATYTAGIHRGRIDIVVKVDGVAMSSTPTVTLTRDFYLGDNAATIECPDADVGDTGRVGGVTYTKRARSDDTVVASLDTLIGNGDGPNGWDRLPTTCTSGVTDFHRLFRNVTGFNEDLGTWDTSSVTLMSDVFTKTAFDQDIGDWDTGNVTTMASMFYNAPFNQDIGRWNTSSVTNFMQTFYGAHAFDQDIGGWDTSAISPDKFDGKSMMFRMFYNASAFDQDLSGWCVSAITASPTEFDAGAAGWTQPRPAWGTCP